jgi:hypothetical protein
MVRLWKRLDASRPNSVPGIRAATSPAPLAGLDDTVITLPVKLGGLGFLSFKTSAPLSFAAASEASDTLLAPHIDTANQTVLSQRERCQEAFFATVESLLSRWTRRVPNQSWKCPPCSEGSGVRSYPSPALMMTDFEVSGAEHACTLLPGATVRCRHCGAPNRLGHDEICLRRAPKDHCKA